MDSFIWEKYIFIHQKPAFYAFANSEAKDQAALYQADPKAAAWPGTNHNKYDSNESEYFISEFYQVDLI